MENPVIPEDAEQPNVLHALVNKRKELAGRVEANRLELIRLLAALDHVDATIHVFNPNIQLADIPTKAPRNATFKGEVTRVVLSTLREAKAPMSCREIADVLLEARGLPLDEPHFKLTMTKRVAACLNIKRREGIARVAPSPGRFQAWELVR